MNDLEFFERLAFHDKERMDAKRKQLKKEYLNEGWYGGETLLAAIGQGYVLTTPLQLAVMTSRIASGGMKITPSIIKNPITKEYEIMKKYSNEIKILQKHLAINQIL